MTSSSNTHSLKRQASRAVISTSPPPAPMQSQIVKMFVDGPHDLTPGQIGRVYVSWHSCGAAQLAIKLLGHDGIVYGEALVAVTPGEQQRQVPLAVCKKAVRGTRYTLSARLLKLESSWDRYEAAYDWPYVEVR